MSHRPASPSKPVQIILGSVSALPLPSLGRGVALVLIELGAAALFAAGIADRAIGDAAPWFLLVAVVIGFAVRAVDLESCALLIPGGFYGAARDALGRPAARMAASALLVDRVLFAALAAASAGHYAAVLVPPFLNAAALERRVTVEDLATTIAAALIGVVWWRQRQGRALSSDFVGRTVSAVVAALSVVVAWGVGTVIAHGGSPRLAEGLHSLATPGWTPGAVVSAIGACLFAIGSADALRQVAPEFPQPTIRGLRRAVRLANVYSVVITAATGILFLALVPQEPLAVLHDAPGVAIALNLSAPAWAGTSIAAAVAVAAFALLSLTVQRAATGAQHVLSRLSEDDVLAGSLRALHPRFGTPFRLIDLTAAGALAAVVATAGQVRWIAGAYAVGVVWAALLKIGALLRLRALRPAPGAFRVPFNPRIGGREWPVGLAAIAAALGIPSAYLVLAGNPASLAGAALVVALSVVFTATARAAAPAAADRRTSLDTFELLTRPAVGLDDVDVRPGNVLVSVRKPHFMAHLTTALQAAGDRDVVVITVRLMGVDVSDHLSPQGGTTDDERRLLGAAAALAERHGRAVRLLIVPATNVFDAIISTVLRLRSSEIYVGESETLAADDQARLLGEAWERAAKTEPLDVRLVIHHSSGRTATYHLGAHPPTLGTDDLQLIHSLWLDAVKSVGPHVHHRDVVRAALKHMDEQLKTGGPPREAALEAVRQTSRPADELAAVAHQRDFARLRDMVRNRPPSDIATILTDLALEDQVLVFRVLPRKLAAGTFEYLSRDAQETLLKAMAQEDVAGLLNDMAPDDRTMFLEELPASATQQLLALLTPEERAVAARLLGYPEGSIGRLMTPDYIAVREHWTVQEVLDYVRAHGHDSETLNVIYVVDDHGVLVDDVRIREFLLTATTNRVADLMDRRFVALKAADDQSAAVAVFRGGDYAALPVTDSTGVLIGIVTIDDVLDVAEAAATQEIQRIGGSEALDEPYMEIGFARMIRKRAGWLTALFLGEMLTATAMGVFQHEIERAVVLALFVPLIISSGGNSGSQASTLVIRAIALGEVTLADWWRVMRREVAAGLALGSILGLIGFLRITIWSTFSTIYGVHWLLVALTVSLALVGVVLWGTLVGSLLPFVLRRLGFDPATSSAPFVATLVDVTGLIIYFTVGIVVLRGTVL